MIAPNILGLAGLIQWLGLPGWLRLPLALVGAGLALVRTRRQSVDAALRTAVAAGLVFGPRAMIYDGVFLLPALLPRFSAAQTIAAGSALGLVVTPVRPLVELASPVWLWVARPPHRPATTPVSAQQEGQGP